MLKFITTSMLIISLGAVVGCANTDTVVKDENKKPKITVTNESKKKVTPNREKTKKIEVKVEGGTEWRDARLMYNDGKDYSIYILNDYTFSAEEPNKDVILSNFDGDFFVRIENLGANANINAIKESFTKGYESLGNVIQRDPSTVFAEKFKDSKLWLHVDIPESDNIKVQTTINYLVKDFNGEFYAFTFHMPLKEAMEGITPSLWSMVSTMEIE